MTSGADPCPECGSAMDRVEPPAGTGDGSAPRLICPRCNHETQGS